MYLCCMTGTFVLGSLLHISSTLAIDALFERSNIGSQRLTGSKSLVFKFQVQEKPLLTTLILNECCSGLSRKTSARKLRNFILLEGDSEGNLSRHER